MKKSIIYSGEAKVTSSSGLVGGPYILDVKCKITGEEQSFTNGGEFEFDMFTTKARSGLIGITVWKDPGGTFEKNKAGLDEKHVFNTSNALQPVSLDRLPSVVKDATLFFMLPNKDWSIINFSGSATILSKQLPSQFGLIFSGDTVPVSVTFTGLKQSESIIDDTPEKPVDPTPNPNPPPSGETPRQRHTRLYPHVQLTGGNESGVATNSTLWKPVADSAPRTLVIVTGHNLPQMRSIQIERGGSVIESKSVSGVRTAGNGFRLNWKMGKPGSAYGSGLTLRVKTVDGDYVGSIASGGKRTTPTLKKVSGGTPTTPTTPTDPGTPTPPVDSSALFNQTPNSITLRADFAEAVSRIDAMADIVEPGNPHPIFINPTRSGNTWTIPQALSSYKTGNRPNTWRIRLIKTPPAGVTYHTSIMQTFVRVGDNPMGPGNKTYPPSTRA